MGFNSGFKGLRVSFHRHIKQISGSPFLHVSHNVRCFLETTIFYSTELTQLWGKRWRSWLRHYATKRKVAGSIPDGVIGIFHLHNPSGRTIALGLTQPLTEMSTRGIYWGGKGGRCVGLTTLPPSCADCLEIWEPQPPGTLRACPGL